MSQLNELGYAEPEAVRELEHKSGAHCSFDDLKRLGRNIVPRVAKLDSSGAIEEHITEEGGNYSISVIDYLKYDDSPAYPYRVAASRVIASIERGQRTELVYRTHRATDGKLLIHRGQGSFMIGQPDDNRTRTFTLDAEVTPAVNLSPRTFYTVRASSWARTTEPLVVSTLSVGGFNGEDAEITVEHDRSRVQDTVETPEGTLKVPIEFGLLYEVID